MPVKRTNMLEDGTGAWSGSVMDVTTQGNTTRTVTVKLTTGTFGRISDAKTILSQIVSALDAAQGVMGGE